MRAAIYARVSSDAQATPEKRSWDVQVQQCTAYVERNGWMVSPQHVYREVGKRRQYLKREELQDCLEAAERHEYDVLIIWCLDRLSDDLDNFIRAVTRLRDAHVALKGATEEIDILSQEGYWLTLTKIQWMVAPENPRRALRTKEARRRYTEEGKPWVSHTPRYGYRWVIDPARVDRRGVPVKERLEADPATAPVVVWMYERAAEGKTLWWIAHDLNQRHIPTPRQHHGIGGASPVWKATTIRNMLAFPGYMGQWPAYRTRLERVDRETVRQKNLPPEEWYFLKESPAPALVSEQLWHEVQRRFANNKLYAQRNAKQPLSYGVALLARGMARCGRCGRPMNASPRGYTLKDGTVAYEYRCRGQQRGYGECPRPAICIDTRQLDNAVWAAFGEVLCRPDLIARLARRSWLQDHPEEAGVKVITPADELVAAQNRLAEIEQGITALSAHVEKLLLKNPDDPAITGYDQRIRILQAQLPGQHEEVDRAERKVAEYARHQETVATWQQYLEVAGWNADLFASDNWLSADSKRRWLEALGARVVVNPRSKSAARDDATEAPMATLHLHLTATKVLPELPGDKDGGANLDVEVRPVILPNRRPLPPDSPLNWGIHPTQGSDEPPDSDSRSLT